jgi:peptide-methionine (S)-S-oxide reductase
VQKRQAEASLKKADQSDRFLQPVVTVVEPLTDFFPAEEYHQDYYAKNPNQPYCQIVISPKLNKFMAAYKSRK